MRRRVLPLLCLPVLALAACGDDDSGDSAAQQKAADTGAERASGGCPDVKQPAPREDGGQSKPAEDLDPNGRYVLTLDTSCGSIEIRIDQKTAPKTAASVVALARNGFYDKTIFHRIVPGFVIQGGDPTASGTGGPGYSVRDQPPADTQYVKGVVAMAKTEQEPPGTSGSQFYIVTGPDAGLPPDYAVLGKVVKGQDVVDEIGQLGDPASGGAGTPTKAVVIEKATVSGG
ncbi:MAG: peptidylprolyl isomerase [Thermoleophilaceae bacterium]|nr:peptidylprolyl isomerase [Thermoleophilaceae bacterium]